MEKNILAGYALQWWFVGIFILSGFMQCHAGAPTHAERAELNRLIQAVMNCKHVPGIAISVVQDDQVVYQNSYGFADIENDILVNEHTLFPIASTTKAFTTFLLAQLLENSSYTWDTPVSTIDKDFRFYNDFLTKHVTLRDVLTHFTGIPGQFMALLAGYPQNFTSDDIVNTLRYHKPTRDYRYQFMYNNYMYVLAGHLVEVLSGGTKWKDLIQENIFQPLGMIHSSFISEMKNQTVLDNVAKSYVFRNHQILPTDRILLNQVLSFSSAGAILSNAEDMAKWIKFNLRLGKTETNEQLLSEDAMNELFHSLSSGLRSSRNMYKPTYPVSDVNIGYALGWMKNVYRGYERIWHSGGIHTYQTQLWLLPEINAGFFVAANGPRTPASKWSMINLSQLIADMITGEDFWLDEQTICSSPEPWGSIPNTTDIFYNDSLPHPVEYYVGTYRHPAFQPIIVYNISLHGIGFTMGLYMNAHLNYSREDDQFYPHFIDKYWYLGSETIMPLKFGNVHETKGKKQFHSLYVTLNEMQDDEAAKSEFLKTYSSKSSDVTSNRLLYIFLWKMVTIYSQFHP